MIIRSKAPLRLGLAGGGSDVSPYCDIYGGLVLNATINLYAYCTIEETNDGLITINSYDADVHKSFPSAPKPYLVAVPDKEDFEPLDTEEKAKETDGRC